MERTTEVAQRKTEATEVALGTCEGELMALKQQKGDEKKALEQVNKNCSGLMRH